MLQWGLYAAALRLPFLPTRAGLHSGVMDVNPHLRTVRSPYDDAEELVAVPAISLDVALVHMNRADAAGNGQFLGPDLYFDDRLMTDGVVEAPNGAHFTSCDPDYGRDEAFQKEYAASEWEEFRARWIDLDEAEYQVRARQRVTT
jgi:glutaconate CoA-transferase subunit A